jgi:hypothetical protein
MKLIKIRADEPITRGIYFETNYVSAITIFDLIADNQRKLQIEPVTLLRYRRRSPQLIEFHYDGDDIFLYLAVGTSAEIDKALEAFPLDPQYIKI